MKIGSLFSGYSGLDMAVANVTGAETAWFVEYDDAPSKILATHYPNVPNYGDVSKVDWAAVEPVDILTGGFPCQDVSLAGARRGMAEGTRSGLWSEFAKAIEVIKPRLVVIENVRGLLSATAHSELEFCAWCMGDEPSEPALRALGAVLGDLADLGYDAEWQGLRAADAGAPHNRFRVFIVAYPSGGRDGGGMTSPAMAKAKGQTLRLSGQIVDMVEPGRLPQPESKSDKKLPTPTTRDYKDGNTDYERDGVVQTDTVARAVFSGDWGQFQPAIERWEQVLGRPAPKPTNPDGRDGAHRLSSKFTEWMMGMPEGWITDCGLSRNDELKACGNGVVPQQAELALRMLLNNAPLETERERTVKFPTPTVSDTFTDNLASSQQKPGSMHSVTLPQAVRMVQ